MSKIALTPNASGTGTLTIAAPNTNTDRTLTLPDASGTVFTDTATLGVSQLPPQLSVSGSAAAGSFSIDSAGRVMMPYQPAFSVIRSTTTGGTNATLIISSGTVNLNVGSHFNNANGRFTAPVSGVYFLTLTVNRDSQSGSTPQARIRVNGNNLIQALIYSTAYSNGSMSYAYYMSAGDYADAVVVGVNNGTPDYHTAYFSGYLIG